ncbi:MAG: ATP-dependent sacrificial sulfur transferase LarE [Nanoarchaeota archaeon]
MNKELNQKYKHLREIIERLGRGIVAFSGGIDSALVLKVAYDVLGNKVIAVTADSPSLPKRELNEAREIVQQIGARHIVITTKETENQSYLKNPSNRCYHCKSELYAKLKTVSQELGIKNIINGTNFDDLDDYRPGLLAADENNVTSPLVAAKFTKNDVRKLANHLGLKIWDKPSSPCLSSRVPYGQEITLKKLAMIEEAENFLKGLGIRELRVRHFGNLAKIEASESGRKIAEDNFHLIQQKFRDIGFAEVAISNFRSGSLNLMLNVRAEN